MKNNPNYNPKPWVDALQERKHTTELLAARRFDPNKIENVECKSLLAEYAMKYVVVNQ
jgi:hypothetical protein